MISDLESSYSERSIVLARDAIKSVHDRVNCLYGVATAAGEATSKNIVIGVNAMREIGLELQSSCGNATMSHTFWQHNFIGKVGFDFETAKHFMAVARKMVKKANKLSDALPCAQLMLIATDEMVMPEREQKQIGNPTPPLQRWFNDFTGFRQMLQKVETVTPMEKWGREGVEQFLAETEWLPKERARAEKLLEGE